MTIFKSFSFKLRITGIITLIVLRVNIGLESAHEPKSLKQRPLNIEIWWQGLRNPPEKNGLILIVNRRIHFLDCLFKKKNANATNWRLLQKHQHQRLPSTENFTMHWHSGRQSNRYNKTDNQKWQPSSSRRYWPNWEDNSDNFQQNCNNNITSWVKLSH